MQSSSDAIVSQPDTNTPPLSRSATIGFYIVAVLFNLCLTVQLLTVGLAYFYNSDWWQTHVWLVRGYSGLSLILLAWVYWVPFPKRVRTLTISFPILLGLQFLTIHVNPPLPFPLGIFHPLLGFVLVSASATVVHRVWRILSADKTESESNPI